jgi:uncharacterized membrane protein
MTTGIQIAAAMAALLAATGCGQDDGSDTSSTSQNLVKCQGINECAGQSECATAAGNSCEGLNECRGMGWITVSADECDAKGGTVIES